MHLQGSAQDGWSGGQISSESAYTTCKSGGYLPVSGGQLHSSDGKGDHMVENSFCDAIIIYTRKSFIL